MLDAKASHKNWSCNVEITPITENDGIYLETFGDFESLQPGVKVAMIPFLVFVYLYIFEYIVLEL